MKELSNSEQEMFAELIVAAYDCFVIDEETKNALLECIDTPDGVFF